MVFIFFPNIKSLIDIDFKKGEDFIDLGGYESFSYSFVKPTNASSVIRGRGVIDGRSSPFEDRAITLSFTVSSSLFKELLFFYNLSNIFGLIPIKNAEVFNHIFKPYAKYLEDEAYVNLFNIDKSTNDTGGAFAAAIKSALVNSNGNFFAFLRRMSVKTIPGRTAAFSVEMELVPYFFSLNLVLRKDTFWTNYNREFAKKKDVLKTLYQNISKKQHCLY